MSKAAAGSARQQAADPGRSFEDFYRAEQGTLLRALCLLTGNLRDAEDVLQDAFLRVWLHWDRVRSMDNAQGYLYRVALNVFRSRHRRATRLAERIARHRSAAAAGSADPLVELAGRDAVWRALNALPPRQRSALVLIEFVGYSSEEAARVLRVQPVTVRVAVSRARDGLRKALEGATTDE